MKISATFTGRTAYVLAVAVTVFNALFLGAVALLIWHKADNLRIVEGSDYTCIAASDQWAGAVYVAIRCVRKAP
jgi:hypothetical protein